MSDTPDINDIPRKQRAIIEAVAHAAGFTVDDLLGKASKHRLCRARRACFMLMRSRMDMTYQEIADIFWRDVSTVRMAVLSAGPPSVEMMNEAMADLHEQGVTL